MVIGAPWLFVMVVVSALSGEFTNGASDTSEQIGSVGPIGVCVGDSVIGVLVNVRVGVTGVFVSVAVGVFVRVAVGVFVRVGATVNVLVGPGVFVGPGFFVAVRVDVGPGEGVDVGRTSRVFVAGIVDEGV